MCAHLANIFQVLEGFIWSPVGLFQRLALWVKFLADNILKYFFSFPRKQVLTLHANGLPLHKVSNPVIGEK